MKNRYLILLLAAISLAGNGWPADSSPPNKKNATKVHRVDVQEFDKLRSAKTNVVLDVRTENEFKAGHIPGAVNIDVNSPEFDKKVGELDKNKTYLVHCAGGVRSAKACKKLETIGFKGLYDLAPGFRGWEKA